MVKETDEEKSDEATFKTGKIYFMRTLYNCYHIKNVTICSYSLKYTTMSTFNSIDNTF